MPFVPYVKRDPEFNFLSLLGNNKSFLLDEVSLFLSNKIFSKSFTFSATITNRKIKVINRTEKIHL